MAAPPGIEEIDALEPDACAAALAPLFEGAPAFLARLCAARPFGSETGLFNIARSIAHAMREADQIELIDAHPRLGAPAASVSALSFVEQGYDRESAGGAGAEAERSETDAERPVADAERERLRLATEFDALNAAYEARFGFRYCVFVAGRPRAELIPGVRSALDADRADELSRAVDAVIDIAADRWANRPASDQSSRS